MLFLGFHAGKFDQLHRDIPYQALVAAFQELVRQLLTETTVELQQWQEKIGVRYLYQEQKYPSDFSNMNIEPLNLRDL